MTSEDDLYETWDEIAARRRAHDIVFAPELDAHEILSYELITEVLKDSVTFSNAQTTLFTLEPSLANLDPPEHAPLRRVLVDAFSKGAVAELTPPIIIEANRLIDALPGPGDAFDVKSHFAVPLALHTIMGLLRIPEEGRETLRAGTEAVESMAAGVRPTRELVGALRAVDDYFLELAANRLAAARAGSLDRNPRDPVAALVWAHVDGVIADLSSLARNIAVLFNGGNGTTSTLVTNAVHALEHNPEQKAIFLGDPGRFASGVVEETLRYEASTHGLFRTATCPAVVGSVAVESGERVFCRFGSGSRDPNAFPEPDRFDISRDWTALPQHLGFGFGAHFCIGAPLARVEIATALTTLYERLAGLRLTRPAAVRRLPGLIFRGWESLDMTYDDRRSP